MKILFWLSISIIFYVYLGYPVIVYLLSLFYKKPIKGKYLYPTVSAILTIHDGEVNIENKILSLLQLEYPEERLDILIGSDGSTAESREMISKYKGVNDRITFYEQEKKEGKPNMLNKLASMAKGEILLFTDAQHRFDKDFLKELVRNFTDAKVGFISVDLLFGNIHDKTSHGLGLYWKYERFIRKCESKIGSMLGGTDSTYAIRKELFPKLPKELILDDVYIPMKIIQKGYRAIFDHKAKFYDKAKRDIKSEFQRKTRNLAGNFQLLLHLNKFLRPFSTVVVWQFFSHKFLRLIVPFLLTLIFVANIFILQNHFYWTVMVLQVIFYTFALLGVLNKRPNRLFDVPRMFCVMNAAAVAGLYKFARNKEDVL